MSVINQNARDTFVAVAGATVFPFSFKVNSKADLLVLVDGEAKTVDVDFTVTGAGVADGGLVTFAQQMEGGEFVVIRRNMTLQRLTDYQNLGDLRAGTLNADLDAVVMMVQQLATLAGQSIRVGDSYHANVDPVLPQPSPMSLIGWDQTAQQLANYSPEGFVAAATAGVQFTVNVSAGQTTVPLPGLKSPWAPQLVAYNGIVQDPGAFTISPSGLQFAEPLPAPGKVMVVAVFGSPTQITESESLTFKLQAADSVTRAVRDKLGETVSVKDFGATGDGVTDDTLSIRAGLDYLKSRGGGTLFFPEGIYIVHLVGPKNTSTTFPNTHALHIDFDNLRMVGAGRETTILRAKETNGNYGIILFGRFPITNGNPQINDGSVESMTIDGNSSNPAPGLDVRAPAIIASGLQRYVFRDLCVMNSSQYGIGLQNGGHKDVIVDNVYFLNNGRNAIDVKNNGSVNEGLMFTNLIVDHCGWVDYIDEKSSMLSVTGVGCTLSNIVFKNIPTGDDTLGRVLRLKPGTEGYSQGVGARATTVSNIQIQMGNTFPASMECAIEVGCEKAVLSNVVVTGASPIGIRVAQPGASISGGVIDGPDIGIQFRNRNLSADVQPYAGATDCSVVGVQIANAAVAGISVEQSRASVIGNVITGCDIGVRVTVDGTDSTVALNTLSACTTPLSFATSTNQRAFNNSGAVNPVFRSIVQSTEAQHLAVDFPSTARFYANGVEVLRLRPATNGVNYWDMYPSAAGAPLQLMAQGSDTDIDLRFVPKGAGVMRFGTHTALGSETLTGYITIRDSGGTLRKLAVIS